MLIETKKNITTCYCHLSSTPCCVVRCDAHCCLTLRSHCDNTVLRLCFLLTVDGEEAVFVSCAHGKKVPFAFQRNRFWLAVDTAAWERPKQIGFGTCDVPPAKFWWYSLKEALLKEKPKRFWQARPACQHISSLLVCCVKRLPCSHIFDMVATINAWHLSQWGISHFVRIGILHWVSPHSLLRAGRTNRWANVGCYNTSMSCVQSVVI